MEKRFLRKSNAILARTDRSSSQFSSSGCDIVLASDNSINMGVSVMVSGQPITGYSSGYEVAGMANGTNVNLHGTERNWNMEHTLNNPWIFLTGACGYIGSHLSAEIKTKTNFNLMQIDNRAKLLPHTTRYCDLYADEDFSSDLVLQSIEQYKPDTVIHLAASSSIGPGQVNPLNYWDNNVVKTLKLIDTCVKSNVKNFIFASTSAVYDDNLELDTVSEASQINPITAYARTKYSIELALQDCWHSYKMNSISFRFFNAAGSHHFYDLGPLYGSSHLLAKIMESIVHQIPLTVYGNDYPTPDGTAIRDYIHVLDIADAIVTAVPWLKTNSGSHVINLGNGNGYSVQDVINETEAVLNKNVPYRYGARRDGDSIKRVSNAQLARDRLGWVPTRNLGNIIKDSYKWYNSSVYKKLHLDKIWLE